MLKFRLIVLFGIAVSAVVIIASLYSYSTFQRQYFNHFVREYPPFIIVADQVKKLPYTDLYIAGITGDSIYLSSRQFKNFLIIYRLKDLGSKSFFVKADKNIKVSEDAEIQIASNRIFLMQGSLASIRSGFIHQMAIKKELKSIPFTTAIPISASSFVVRFYNKKKENALGKMNTQDLKLIEKPVLEKQVDGMFCTDGVVVKGFGIPNLFYVYYYRNKFLSIDTNLKVNYEAKTIDTNTRAKIKISKIRSTGEITLSAPPVYVNKNAAANRNYLFVQSALKADNETDKISEKTTPIDVYRLEDGKYLYSFYIPDFAGEKLTNFKVNENTFVALYKKYLYTFKLNFNNNNLKGSKQKTTRFKDNLANTLSEPANLIKIK